MKDSFSWQPRLALTFGQIAKAITQVRSPFLCFRAAATARNTGPTPWTEAIIAFKRQRYMSHCYLPSWY